ncbi:hypothetical protein Bhyg_03722 [Pseudolycoriella hygida]|nr:hypothetical protein Bhyg_17058 [Pseudolycoriella hygida]KAJ6636782.1 hypothetical protein Bhyg_15377 [Pseudolycoriella hygida]KAJ6639278.1 hypothetical protein Bhyg_12021 [Pseudolycoriella hygida]KAJ6648492.1 hypothetical protein Bhyg_03722 [Pseudolycoriella hygida]
MTEHECIPDKFAEIIAKYKKVNSIEVLLNDEQVKLYYHDGKFIFKNVELGTRITFGSFDFKSPVNEGIKRNGKKTKNIVFMSGITNPVRFLAQFEKCDDMKTDRDKLWRIRHFVDEQHKAEFSQLRFTSDWVTARRTFVEKYSVPFLENKKKEINIDFNKEPDLRSFVNRKLLGLSTYTTLAFVNQMEIILNDLPEELAYLFMVNEIFNCSADDLLDFCDSVQEVVDTHNKGSKVEKLQQFSMNTEDLNCDTDELSDSASSASALQEQSSAHKCGLRKRVRESGNSYGRPSKRNLTSIPEDESCAESEDFTFLNEMSSSRKSTWSSFSGSLSNLSSLK